MGPPFFGEAPKEVPSATPGASAADLAFVDAIWADPQDPDALHYKHTRLLSGIHFYFLGFWAPIYLTVQLKTYMLFPQGFLNSLEGLLRVSGKPKSPAGSGSKRRNNTCFGCKRYRLWALWSFWEYAKHL